MPSDTDEVLPALDDEPDEWVDWEDAWEPTDEEISLGNELGQQIDVADDTDDGGVEPVR